MSPGLAGLGAHGAWGLWGLGLVGLVEFRLAGLVSRWAHLIPLRLATAPLTEHASRWVSMGSGESALSELSELSFMTVSLT